MTLTDSSTTRSMDRRSLFCDEENGVTIERDYGIHHDFFRQVVDIRSGGDGPVELFCDPYSYHYLLKHRGEPIGAMSVTWLADGEMDCQAHYPDRLLHHFHSSIISGSRFRINRSSCTSIKTLRQFIGSVFQDHVEQGCRLNVLNAEKKSAPFYRRMGFQVVKGSDFIHPELGTESVALLLAVDPDHRSFFQPIFTMSDCPLPQQEAIAACYPIFQDEDRQTQAAQPSTQKHLPTPTEVGLSQ